MFYFRLQKGACKGAVKKRPEAEYSRKQSTKQKRKISRVLLLTEGEREGENRERGRRERGEKKRERKRGREEKRAGREGRGSERGRGRERGSLCHIGLKRATGCVRLIDFSFSLPIAPFLSSPFIDQQTKTNHKVSAAIAEIRRINEKLPIYEAELAKLNEGVAALISAPPEHMRS